MRLLPLGNMKEAAFAMGSEGQGDFQCDEKQSCKKLRSAQKSSWEKNANKHSEAKAQ